MHIKIFFFIIIFSSGLCLAQEPESAEQLGQKSQNPLADLVLIPFQNNITFNNTQNRGTGYLLNIQPVFPIKFKKFSIINRVVFGLGYMPGITAGGPEIPIGWEDDGQVDGTWGALDLNWTSFFTGKPIGSFSWGVGPSATFPTASDNRLGGGKWSLGPSAVFVWQPKKWTVDVIFRQLWSVGGNQSRPDVNQLYIQPLVAYNITKGWAFATMPVITVNWNFPEGNKALVPIGGGVNKLFFLGKLPVLSMFHYYHNIERPALAPSSELRIQFSMILSK